MAGDPEPDYTVDCMHQLVESGANIIELGVPFSDPSAEGPVIQRAHERALEHRVGLKDIFPLVAKFRERDSDTPVVLMGYDNPIEWMGVENFCQQASEAGVDGVLVVDLPPEESASFNSQLEQQGLLNVFLLAPTTSEDRIQTISDAASGFLYYVSVKGVTGAGHLDTDDVEKQVNNIKQRSSKPVCVGFGIKDAESAAAVAKVSDGVVVGSALVQKIADAGSKAQALDTIDQFVTSLRVAVDQT